MRAVVNNTMAIRTDDVVVIGSGIGGLVCALSLAPKSVTLITKTPQPHSGSSLLAQGGIAAAVGPDDSPEAHAADTVSAGAGLSDPQRTRELTDEGAASLEWLLQEGIAFDRDLQGSLSLAKEAAHQAPRNARARGGATRGTSSALAASSQTTAKPGAWWEAARSRRATPSPHPTELE